MDELQKLIEGRNALYDEAEKLTDKSELTADEETRWEAIKKEISDKNKSIKRSEEKIEMQKEIALNESIKKQSVKDLVDSGAAGDTETKEEKEERKAKVTNDNKKTKEYRNAKTFTLIQSQIAGDVQKRQEAQLALAEGGHYDGVLEGKTIEERGGFSTLLDPKGGVLVPTTISSEIMDIMQNYGVVPRLSLNLGDISQNSLKIPQVLGRPAFTAVTQGGAITGSGFNLGGIELKALKWGAIIDWTNEVDESVGARLMPIIMDKLAEGYAFVQDNAFFNGDGTSTYNAIKGLEGLTGTVNYVRTATAASGNVSFATLDPDDFILPQENVAPGARAGCVYVMHPNLIFTLRKLKDTQGKYIYGDPSEVTPAGTLWGFPIETSEAFAFTDGTTKTVCAFYNPRYLAYATGRSLTAVQLKEGTITNEDSTSVNLATQDSTALRVTGLFDLVMSSVTRTTGSTAQGAFSVLRTAAS